MSLKLNTLAIAVMVALSGTAHAQTDKAAARVQEQARKLRAQVQQLQQAEQARLAEIQAQQQKFDSEKSTLASQAKRAGGEAAKLRQQLAEMEKLARENEVQLSTLKQERDALSGTLATTQEQLKQRETTLATTETRLRERDTAATMTLAKWQAEEKERNRCEANNVALYQYGRELMDLYQGKGMWSSLRQAEPLTGLGNVRIQNILEEYRDKLDSQKLSANGAAASRP